MHGAHLNVLLVEDDPIAARVIQKMLSPDQGGPVTLQCADRLSTGLEYLAEAKTDAVLLDLGLPDSQGLATLVRVLEQAPGVPVIVFTAADDEALAAEALERGAQDYLVKGQVDTELLVRALRHATERGRMLAQLQQAQEMAAQVVRTEARLEAAQRIEEKNAELEKANEAIRQAMQELRAANAYNRSLLEASLEPLFTIARDGKIGDVNLATETITGFSREALVGTDFSDYFTNPALARTGYQQVFRDGRQLRDYGLEIVHQDGHTTPVLYSVSVYRDEAGQVAGVIPAAQDVTERLQAEAALRASERRLLQSEKLAAIGGLVAGVGHELNNPLMGVINYTQYCLERTAEDDPRHSRMAKAVREAQRCGRIVKALLSYSHRSQDETHADGEEVNCHALIMEMVSLLAADLRQLSVEVTVRAAEDLPPIRLDADALRQIVLNLLTNARDAVTLSTRKEITVQATVAGTSMTLSVQDSGCGMSEEVLNRLFDPFFTTKPAGQGTGLGMGVCQNLAEQSGGTIEVESKLGEGTVVTVRLPINQGFVDQAHPPTGTDSGAGVETEQSGSAPTKQEADTMAVEARILVIDDEESVRDAFVDALEGMPFVVMTASGGPEALEILRGGPVSLVFLDLKMPGMDGVDVLRKIREADGAVPAYIVTAFYAEFLSRLQAAEDEGLAFQLLCKPVGQEAIRKVTTTALGYPGPEGGKAQ